MVNRCKGDRKLLYFYKNYGEYESIFLYMKGSISKDTTVSTNPIMMHFKHKTATMYVKYRVILCE